MSGLLYQYDPKIVSAVKEVILRHVSPLRIYLFGSRVSGEARPESDYDFAFDAPEADYRELEAMRADIEEMPNLFRIDIANIAKADSRFANRVRDTGLVIYSATKALRSQDGMMYFDRALERFRIVVTEREQWKAHGNGDIVLDVASRRFEFTYEMAWKSLKRVLDYLGIDARSPRQVFKEAFAQGLLSEEEVWLEMIEMRNLALHVYDEHEIAAIMGKLDKFLAAFDALHLKLHDVVIYSWLMAVSASAWRASLAACM